MKLAWGNGQVWAVLMLCAACAPERLELGDAPLQAGGAGSGAVSGSGGSADPGGAPSTPSGGSIAGDAGATNGDDCVSPTQHPERGYDEDVTFCACDGDQAQCVSTESQGFVGYVCEGGTWTAVLDGPCGVEKACYSPTQHPERSYDEGAIGCACDSAASTCVEVDEQRIALICNDGVWTAVQDGPCELLGCNEARRCIQCGPAGGCAIYEVSCFSDPDCEDGVCGVSCL